MVEFGVGAEFNNERLFLECDIIFVCIQPGQAGEVFKEVKHIIELRVSQARQNPKLSPPLIVSCLAAVGIPKLKLMLT